MRAPDAYLKFLARMRDEGEISPAEFEILAGYVEWRNTVKPTPTHTNTRIKQASAGVFVARTLHQRGARLDTCTGKDLLKVANYTSSGKFTKNSRQTMIVTLKAIAKYIHRFHHPIPDLDDNLQDVKAGTTDKGRKEVLTLDEWEQVLNAPMSAKERAMIAMLYDGYHRPREIQLLQWSDLKINAGGSIEYEITFKTEKPRVIVQKGQTTAILEMWRQECGASLEDATPIFPDRDGRRYESLTQIKKLFNRLKKKTGIRKLKPSMLRNTAITHDVDADLPLSYICLRAWGEPYNEMINIYVKSDSGKMQQDQHKKNGLDTIALSKTASKRTIGGVRMCPSCPTANRIESVLRIEEADLTRFLQERGFEGTFVKEVAGDGSEVASRAYPIPPAPHPHRSMQGGRSC